jgi:hypothetical protein
MESAKPAKRDCLFVCLPDSIAVRSGTIIAEDHHRWTYRVAVRAEQDYAYCRIGSKRSGPFHLSKREGTGPFGLSLPCTAMVAHIVIRHFRQYQSGEAD